MPSGDPLATLTGHHDRVTSVDLSDDGSLVVSASLDGTLRVWNLAQGAEIHRYVEHPFEHLAVALDAGTGRVFSGSADATVILWTLMTVAAADHEPTVDARSPFTIRSLGPNPSLGHTTIELEMGRPGRLDTAIFNALGQRVSTLHSGWLDAGVARFEWKSEGIAAGAYFYRIAAGGRVVSGAVMCR
jgi:WD40 repeat protein